MALMRLRVPLGLGVKDRVGAVPAIKGKGGHPTVPYEGGVLV